MARAKCGRSSRMMPCEEASDINAPSVQRLSIWGCLSLRDQSLATEENFGADDQARAEFSLARASEC